MRYLLIMTALFFISGRLTGAEDQPAFKVAPIYKDMRHRVLKLNEKDVPALKGQRVYAVLMEAGLPKSVYTLVAAGDGAASLYFSNGGGLIGAGANANVRSESLKVVKMAEGCLKHMKRVDAFPIVKPGEATFYIVTNDGVFSYTAKESDLGEKRDQKLSDLFLQCHALIEEVRIAEEKRKTEQHPAGQPDTRPAPSPAGDQKPHPDPTKSSR